HTIQQQNEGAGLPSALSIGEGSSPSEREADRASEAVVQGRPADLHTTVAPAIQRQAASPSAGSTSALPDSDILIENASPFLASAIGSVTLNGFDTGSAELKSAHRKELEKTARNIVVLLRKYNASTVKVTGFTDTVGTEARNLELGAARA